MASAKTQRPMDIPFWESRYENNAIGWHIDHVHPQLVKHMDFLTNGGKKRFFVPLCGKTKDIPFLLSLGHEVFGIEAVRSPVEELNEQASMGMRFDEKSSIFQTQDGRCTIYCGDLWECPIEKWGPFDCVWDRGSFTAMDYEDRRRYVSVMQRSVAVDPATGSSNGHTFRYLLHTVKYDRSKFPGVPKATDGKDMQDLYEPWAKVHVLEQVEVTKEHPMKKVSGDMGEAVEIFYAIQNK